MSTTVTYGGNQYNVPAYQDTGYAQGTGNLSSYLIALATGSLTLSGGTFTLTADVNFGASFGLISAYFTSRTSNAATAGSLRLANTDRIEWRDNANANNLILAMNATQTGGGTYTIPDIGAGISASFVMTAAAQTIAGVKTFSSLAIGSAGFQAGASGTAAVFDSFPGTAASGRLRFQAANSAGDTVTTVTNASQAAARTYTIPDAGASASFVMTEGTQTINGAKTLSNLQGTIGANIAAGGFKFTGLGAGTAAGNSIRFEQLKILQVVSATSTTGFTTTNAAFQTTNLSASITPSAATSTIIVLLGGKIGTQTNGEQAIATLARGGTNILGTSGFGRFLVAGGQGDCPISYPYLDSPASTSALTYAVQLKSVGGGTVEFGVANSTQSMLLIEVNGA